MGITDTTKHPTNIKTEHPHWHASEKYNHKLNFLNHILPIYDQNLDQGQRPRFKSSTKTCTINQAKNKTRKIQKTLR